MAKENKLGKIAQTAGETMMGVASSIGTGYLGYGVIDMLNNPPTDLNGAPLIFSLLMMGFAGSGALAVDCFSNAKTKISEMGKGDYVIHPLYLNDYSNF